jgi:O-antigen/teichoic acid export membrane protein
MSLTKKLASNTLAQLGGKAALAVFGLIEFALITRYLGQTDYGLFATVYGFLMIFGILVDLGLQMTTTVLLSEPDADESKILSNALTIRLVASVIFLGAAPLVGLLFPYPTVVRLGIAVAAIGFVFASLTSTLTSLFQKYLITHRLVLAELAGKIFYIVMLFVVIRVNAGLIGVIGATATATIATFLILFMLSRRRAALRLAFDRDVWKTIFITTWPIAATIALNLIYFKGDVVILSIFRSPAEVGLYSAPYKLLEVLINICYLVLGLILPILSVSAKAVDYARVRSITQRVFDAISITVIPIVVGSYVVATPLMRLIAGDDFAASGEIFPILILATGIVCVAALFGYVVVALRIQRRMIPWYALNAAISLGAYLFFIPKFGMFAAAWITVASEAFILCTALYTLGRELHFFPTAHYAVKALFASSIMILALVLLPSLHVVLQIVVGVGAYAITLWISRGIPPQLRQLLTRS